MLLDHTAWLGERKGNGSATALQWTVDSGHGCGKWRWVVKVGTANETRVDGHFPKYVDMSSGGGRTRGL